MKVSEIPHGESFTVVRVTLPREVGKRLSDMGFTEGAEGTVIRGGFFRGPMQVRIRGYDILIRRCEAAGIEAELCGDRNVEWIPECRGRRGMRAFASKPGKRRHGTCTGEAGCAE